MTSVGLVIGVSIAILFRAMHRSEAATVTGVVLVEDPDTKRQRPIANVRVDAGGISTVTDASGQFQMKFPRSTILAALPQNRAPMSLSLEHPEYVPFHGTIAPNGRIYVLRMKPVVAETPSTKPEIPVSDIRVRYTENTRNSSDTGSALKAFDVVNIGNVPCEGHPPCSPDGKWKAAIGGASLDAGEGNEFREARVSCIAGPCPFTKIETDHFSHGGREISVSVRDWSDTVSFVMEAEVTHNSMSDRIRLSYPFIFGRGMNFSLPPSGEGPSIEASLGGMEIVYPLGPGLTVSWAVCSVQIAKDQAKSYRCDLKPGYRFQ